MANTNTYQAQANELSQKLWAIANELRGQMDASEFKNYILGVIFYRYLSERTEMYMAEILENDGVTYEEAFADDDYRSVVEEWSLTKLGYVIRPENLFRNLIRKITKFESEADRFSVEDFEKAINDLVGSTMGHESNKAFDGLFNDMRLKDARLGESVADRTDMIGRVMVKVSDIDFDLQDSQFDVLGTAYMILIGLFASDAGKKGGEFFTPAGPSRLCATLASLGLDEAKTVGDCTCGSASMLLEVQKHLTTHKVGHFYGQELNATTYNLSRMNMIMHGVDWQNFDIYKGDTLKDDKYGYDLRLTVQVCNAFESKNGKIVNPTNQRESVIQKQIRKSGLLDSFPNVKNVIVTAVTDLPTDEDHNYKFYYSNFERVLMKHNNQIDLYGKNHPGYKTIFLVLDESSAYFEMESIMDNGVIKGKPHYWFWDNSFVNILKKLNIDYLIWYAPFKYYEVPLGEEKSDLPEVCVIDIKNINQNGSYLNSYDISKMKSVEL